jgi:hypothetical protein
LNPNLGLGANACYKFKCTLICFNCEPGLTSGISSYNVFGVNYLVNFGRVLFLLYLDLSRAVKELEKSSVLRLHREDILGVDFLVDISFGVCKSLFQSRTFVAFEILADVHLHFPQVGSRQLFLINLAFLPSLVLKRCAVVVIFVHLDKNLH